MRLWPALILAPLSALASIAFGYALVPAACAGGEWLLHAAIGAFLALAAGATLLASTALKGARDAFLPLVATWTGAFFTLVIAAQWLTRIFVAPCID